MFADALYGDGTKGSGDTARLFKDMENGKVKMEEVIKVIEYMRKMTDDKKVAEYVNTSPEKAFQRMSTAWYRLIMEVNNAGLLNAMTAALNGVATGLKKITPYIKEIKDIVVALWPIVKPMLTLWATVWGVKKVLALAAAMKKLAIAVGLVSAASNAGILGGGGRSKFAKVLARLGMLKTAIFYARKAWLLLVATLKTSFIAVGILALIDMLETLQGKRTVLTQLMGEGGIIGTGAKILVGAFRTMQMLFEMLVAGFHAWTTGDWGFFQDSWDRWKKDMNSIFPFDEWTKGFTTWFSWLTEEFTSIGNIAWNVGKFAVNPMNPMNAAGVYESIQDRNNLLDSRKTQAITVPQMLAKQSPPINITINGTNLSDPMQVAKMVKEEIQFSLIKASSNYVKAQ